MSKTRPIFGFHAVISCLRQNPDSIKEIFIDGTRRDQRARELKKIAEFKGIHLIPCDNQRLDKITGSKRHQGITAIIDTTMRYLSVEDILGTLSEPARFLVLDGIQDPHNLGACLRVADAFGVHAVIAPKDRAVGLTAAVHKVASGAVDTVPYIPVTNLARTLRTLKQHGIWVIGTDNNAEHSLNTFKLKGSIAWIIGAEGQGMRRLTRETCDQIICIPMLGTVESLNVSVSAGICLYETFRQQTASKLVPSDSN